MIELPTPYQQYIHKSRYARYLPDLGRRETWDETVDRYIDNVIKPKVKDKKVVKELREAILNLEVMPSMRALMTAGPALDRDHVAGYNCAYVAVDNVRVFDEILYILMCGTGVGFSVERQYINKLPEIAEEFHTCDTVITVRDSKIGWASALRQLIALLYMGQVPSWDVSKLRPAGAPLKTFGGRSSGPEPLDSLFKYTTTTFKNAAGRQLNSLEVHDLVCKIAEIVVCGGVRRSALLSLSNLTDERMRGAKKGQFFNTDPHRAMANNSVCYTEKPDSTIFLREWVSLMESKSGERGIFSRETCINQLPERREPAEFGTNPCSEIVLRSKQFCNLTEVVLRPGDTNKEVERKVKLATILGTVQATYTDFRYLSKTWKNNTEEERLLGVSLTGLTDYLDAVCNEYTVPAFGYWKNYAVKTNQEWAKKLGIPESTAVTCVKPSGTVSQLVDSSSGMHERYAQYYIRRVRADLTDPLCDALIKSGVPYEIDQRNSRAYVFSFPMKAPNDPLNFPALDQLTMWKTLDREWCEHKPSCTINVREHEWIEVGAWVYKNFDTISGISFFPKDDHVYPQAPYEEITKEEYDKMMETFPETINLNVDEEVDTTTASQELACVGGACEL